VLYVHKDTRNLSLCLNISGVKGNVPHMLDFDTRLLIIVTFRSL